MDYYDYFFEDIDLYDFEKMEPYLFESDEDPSDNSVYKINYYLKNNLQIPYVSNKLENKRCQDELITLVSRFLDEHHRELAKCGPIDMVPFTKREIEKLLLIFEISEDTLKEMYYNMIKETYYGKISKFITGWVENAPHKLLMTAILIDAIQKNNEAMIQCCEFLWGFCEYPILFREYWRYGVKEDVMIYTIEHLGSKFKIKAKNLKTLKDLIVYDSRSSINFYYEQLKVGYDHIYIELMRRMRSQFNSTMKNISSEYYDNYNAGLGQHTNATTYDDGSIADNEGISTNAQQIISNTYDKFINNPIYSPFVKMVAQANSIDKDNVSNFLTQILTTKENYLYKMIENLITIYFDKFPNNDTINKTEFLNYGLALYKSLGTSKQTMYKNIRTILDIWLYKIINIKKYYSRYSTIVDYAKALLQYTVLMVAHYN